MSDFRLFFDLGWGHIMNLEAADHILFLLALIMIFSFKDWRKVLLMVSFFTLAHTASMAALAFGLIKVQTHWVEVGIMLTIIITAISNLIGRSAGWHIAFSFIFGLIHGLGFAHSFVLMSRTYGQKWLLLLAFAAGIEAAQIVLIILFLSILWVLRKPMKISEKILTVALSFFILGYSLSLLLERI